MMSGYEVSKIVKPTEEEDDRIFYKTANLQCLLEWKEDLRFVERI